MSIQLNVHPTQFPSDSMSIRPISKVINNRPTDIQSLPNSRDAIASKKVFSLKTVTELHYCNNFSVHFITLKGKYNINKLFYRTYGNLVIHFPIYTYEA